MFWKKLHSDTQALGLIIMIVTLFRSYIERNRFKTLIKLADYVSVKFSKQTPNTKTKLMLFWNACYKEREMVKRKTVFARLLKNPGPLSGTLPHCILRFQVMLLKDKQIDKQIILTKLRRKYNTPICVDNKAINERRVDII